MKARERFCGVAAAQLGKPALWEKQGPDAFDCSGLVMFCLWECGSKAADHSAQMLWDGSYPVPEYATPLPGDLGFYGSDATHVSHVAIWTPTGVISADGATSKIRDLMTALSNSGRSVRRHDSTGYRNGFLGLRRNVLLDALDSVCR